jgi:hypothetical protein
LSRDNLPGAGSLRPLLGSRDALVGIPFDLPLGCSGVPFDSLNLKLTLRVPPFVLCDLQTERINLSLVRALSELVRLPEALLPLPLLTVSVTPSPPSTLPLPAAPLRLAASCPALPTELASDEIVWSDGRLEVDGVSDAREPMEARDAASPAPRFGWLFSRSPSSSSSWAPRMLTSSLPRARGENTGCAMGEKG